MDPLLIDEEERPPRDHAGPLRIDAAVAPDRPQVRKVAQERIRELEGVRECLLRERDVGADAEDLDVQGVEGAVVSLPG
jgi:hypothetical protein